MVEPEVARSSQSIVPKSKEVLVVSKAPRCDVYSVVSSNDTTGTAKLENPSFKDGVEAEHKQKADEACAKSNKVYIAKQNEKWVYREADQNKTWTVTSQS
ncbi:hypothetical protein MHF_0635 [Mycoplasma haemofelis Ohio2]|uniref:Uncharacterized protein n=1 Tax=Mycoplasma haemofelis (strain Ohio2) TaxID=859194 RepID=F6FI59_MYCHI|nr:hypothetical protein MHF_0635 [Mycoplasma haemofelis Ohio2]